MLKKRMPAAERRQENEASREVAGPALRRSPCITGRIPGLVPGRESALTWAGDAAQYRAQDRRDRRGGRGASRGQGGSGGAGAPVHHVVAAPRGPARAYSEGIKPCEAKAARHSHGGGIVPHRPVIFLVSFSS